MRLQQKTLTIFATAVLAVVVIAYTTARLTFLRSMEELEEKQTLDTLHSLLKLIDNDLARLAAHAQDWGAWDDTYRFLLGENPDYVDANLMDETFANLRVSFMLYFNAKGTLHFAKAFDLSGSAEVQPSAELLDHLEKQFLPLRPQDAANGVAGLVVMPEGPVLLASRSIVTSRYEGPVAGTLVLGRYLDPAAIDRYSKTLNAIVSCEVPPAASPAPPPHTSSADFIWAAPQMRVEPLDDATIQGSAVARDLYGNPALSFKVDKSREISQQARRTLLIYTISLIATSFVLGAAFWLLLNRQVLRRLTRLRGNLSAIAMEKDFTQRLALDGSDEVTDVGASVNTLLDALDEANATIRSREKEVSSILENNPAAILLIHQRDRRISWGNTNALKTVERSQGEITGHPCHELICPEGGERCPAVDERLIGQTVESMIRRRDGTLLPILKSVARITYQGEPHLLAAFFDISAQKQMEGALRQAQKMETVGLLAGGVAHDLNNMLTALVSYPDLILMQLGGDHALEKPLKTLKSSAQKAAAMVEDLLTLARRSVAATEIVRTNELVRLYFSSPEHARLVDLHPQLSFELHLSRDEMDVKASPVQFAKMLMNLVGNAAEATEGPGKVVVSTAGRVLETPLDGYERVPPGEYVVLSVSDTGKGIPVDDLPRIFEPFYTKKSMGRSGTGLGMTIVWNALKDMEGYIDIKTGPGIGTTFELYLPVSPLPAAGQGTPRESAEDCWPGNGERILVVDDMPEQREVAREILERLGYRVETAAGGEEAVQILARTSVDLVLLDMILGSGPDGLDTYRAILETRPGQKALLVSGFAETARVFEALNLGAAGYLKKPYTFRSLGRTVRTALARGDADTS